MTTYYVGAQSLLSLNGVAMAFLSEDCVARPEQIERPGIRGKLGHDSADMVNSIIPVGGPVNLEPSPAELKALLNLWMGGTNGVLYDAPTTFSTLIYRSDYTYSYPTCVMDTLEIAGQMGGAISAQPYIVGQTETTTGSTIASPGTVAPYVMSEATFNYNGSALVFNAFQITLNRHINRRRFMNSQTLTVMLSEDRTINLSITVPKTSDTAGLQTTNLAGASGSIVVYDGASSGTLVFTTLQTAPFTAPIRGKSETEMQLSFQARTAAGSTTGELSMTWA